MRTDFAGGVAFCERHRCYHSGAAPAPVIFPVTRPPPLTLLALMITLPVDPLGSRMALPSIPLPPSSETLPLNVPPQLSCASVRRHSLTLTPPMTLPSSSNNSARPLYPIAEHG